jgi:predicted DNA-binding protein
MYAALYMPATRTQIYLTKQQRQRLDEIRRRDGRSLADVVREAVDQYLENSGESIEDAWEATRGSMPDLEVPSRDEWDRGYG